MSLHLSCFFGFKYYRYNKFELKGVLSLIFDFVGLFLALFSVSSSLATLINPERKSIRVTYAIATFVIVVITYIKYYTTIHILAATTTNEKLNVRKFAMK